MAKARGTTRSNGKRSPARTSASVKLARKGVDSSDDFRGLMSALMTDVIRGDVSPEVVNAACNAGRSILRVAELEYRAARLGMTQARALPLSRRIGTVASA